MFDTTGKIILGAKLFYKMSQLYLKKDSTDISMQFIWKLTAILFLVNSFLFMFDPMAKIVLSTKFFIPFSCFKGCKTRFTAKSSLYIHLKKHDHSGEKFIYPCPMKGCEKKYTTKVNLRNHIMKHYNPNNTSGMFFFFWRGGVLINTFIYVLWKFSLCL